MIAESFPPEHEDCQDFLEVDDDIDGDWDGNQFYIYFGVVQSASVRHGPR